MGTELADFVLDFCRAAGGVVEPPAYGVYAILLPDEAAAQLGVDPFLRVTFEDSGAEADVLALGFGHPIIDRMIELARARPANARFYLNEVRLNKSGLAALARTALVFPNATLVEAPNAVENRALFRSVRFNFKAALISDEKRELLLSVLLDAQTGLVLPDLTPDETVLLAETSPWTDLPLAPADWTHTADPLGPERFPELVQRAGAAAVAALAEPLAAWQARSARHLELDRARLDDYYHGLEHDLTRRLQRTEEEAKRANLEAKLAATRADHQAKLADAEAKYQPRIELDLVNVAVIAQPKLRLTMRVENRQAAVTRDIVWDPLRHQIEPLACEVCRRPARRLYLCANNHLACEHCLAPQCVDCKRVYCQACAQDLTTCVVCDRPVCRKSLTRCPTCGRGTCQAHAGLCHAAGGEPQRVVSHSSEPTPASEPNAQSAPPAARASRSKGSEPTSTNWPAGLTPDESAALAPELERFTQLARGRLYYEGALDGVELVKLTKAAARPGDWFTSERALALLSKASGIRTRQGLLFHLDAAHPLRVAREKAERRLPPLRLTPEQLLAAGAGPLPLTAREEQVSRALSHVAGRAFDLRALQKLIRNTDRPTELVNHVFGLAILKHQRMLDELGNLLMMLWNETFRYELRGRTPNDVQDEDRPDYFR